MTSAAKVLANKDLFSTSDSAYNMEAATLKAAKEAMKKAQRELVAASSADRAAKKKTYEQAGKAHTAAVKAEAPLKVSEASEVGASPPNEWSGGEDCFLID